MKQFNLKTSIYCVCGHRGFSLDEALRLWKTKFETINHFLRDVIKHPGIEKLGEFVEEMWPDTQPVTVLEALSEQNQEKRRVMFDCIGVSKIFTELKPELLDRQTISKVNIRWDAKNVRYEQLLEDTYELYKLDTQKIFREGGTEAYYYAVRCWCTTTQREYWIYVPWNAAFPYDTSNIPRETPDAVSAIAWTIRLDVTHPKKIYRQGDIIVVEESADSQTTTPYHLSKKEYLRLLYSET